MRPNLVKNRGSASLHVLPAVGLPFYHARPARSVRLVACASSFCTTPGPQAMPRLQQHCSGTPAACKAPAGTGQQRRPRMLCRIETEPRRLHTWTLNTLGSPHPSHLSCSLPNGLQGSHAQPPAVAQKRHVTDPLPPQTYALLASALKKLCIAPSPSPKPRKTPRQQQPHASA